MDKSKWGVHEGHCCLKHGCKYRAEDCPVVNKLTVQDFICERCSDSGIKTVSEMTRQYKLEKPGQIKIEIGYEPDEEMAGNGTPHSWCVKKYKEPEAFDYSQWKIVGSGWSQTPEQAYQDAVQSLKDISTKK